MKNFDIIVFSLRSCILFISAISFPVLSATRCSEFEIFDLISKKCKLVNWCEYGKNKKSIIQSQIMRCRNMRGKKLLSRSELVEAECIDNECHCKDGFINKEIGNLNTPCHSFEDMRSCIGLKNRVPFCDLDGCFCIEKVAVNECEDSELNDCSKHQVCADLEDGFACNDCPDENMLVQNGYCVWEKKCEELTTLSTNGTLSYVGPCDNENGTVCVDMTGYKHRCDCVEKDGFKFAKNYNGECQRACRIGRIRGANGKCRALSCDDDNPCADSAKCEKIGNTLYCL